jgi:hypothetical protein
MTLVVACMLMQHQAATFAPNAAVTKPARELYIGGIPQGISALALQQALGQLYLQLSGNAAAGNPIVTAWLSADQSYAFVEFRSSTLIRVVVVPVIVSLARSGIALCCVDVDALCTRLPLSLHVLGTHCVYCDAWPPRRCVQSRRRTWR